MRRNQARKAFWQRWDAMRERLGDRFPAAFPGDGQPRQPLAIGIHRDLIKALKGSFTRRQVRQFLHVWCRRRRYLEALTTASHRIDLAGRPAGSVRESDRAWASALLAARKPMKAAA